MLRLFLFASLCEMLCVCIALFNLRLPPCLGGGGALVVVVVVVVSPGGPTRCVFAIVCLCTRHFTVYTTEAAFGTRTIRCGGLRFLWF